MAEEQVRGGIVVLCDVDGVLVTGGPFAAVLERDHAITPAMTASFFSGPFVACQYGAADLREELTRVLPGWGWSGTADDFLHAWFRAESDVNGPLLALLDCLRLDGVRCYLATTQEPYRAAYLLDELGLARHTDGAFVSCRIGVPKCEPAFFYAVLRQLPGIAAADVLLLDDEQANRRSARQAGMAAIGYTSLSGVRRAVECLLSRNRTHRASGSGNRRG